MYTPGQPAIAQAPSWTNAALSLVFRVGVFRPVYSLRLHKPKLCYLPVCGKKLSEVGAHFEIFSGLEAAVIPGSSSSSSSSTSSTSSTSSSNSSSTTTTTTTTTTAIAFNLNSEPQSTR